MRPLPDLQRMPPPAQESPAEAPTPVLVTTVWPGAMGDLGDGVLAFAVPLALTVICWLGSPRSTALATWAMERTWAVRLDAITLTSSVRFFQ